MINNNNMDFGNRDDVYDALRGWEFEYGESILDGRFGSDIVETTFMSWAVGAGYVTPEQFDMWYGKHLKGGLESPELQEFLYDDYGDIEYAIVQSKDGEYHEEEYEKAFRILAHFITSFIVYQQRLERFLNDEEA